MVVYEQALKQPKRRLRMKLLGGFAMLDGDDRPIALRSRKAQALLALLSLEAGAPKGRDQLIALLWSDRSEAQARSSLRQVLVEIRKALPPSDPPLLMTEGDTLWLDPDEVDVLTFRRHLEEEDLDQAVAIYAGDLLHGIDVRDPAFEQWRRMEAERLRESVVTALDRLSSQRDGEEAISFARRLLSLEPLRESTHRRLMELHARAGDRSAAIRQYEECHAMLESELGIKPDAETEGLLESIRKGTPIGSDVPEIEPVEAVASPVVEALAKPDKPAIAVLPFVNLSGDSAQDYFSDGITDTIIVELSRFKDLFVISSNSSFAYKGTMPKIEEVSRELGVHYVLRGSVQRSAARIRINVELVDGQSGAHVWVQRYDRDAEDLFAVQDDVTERIVGAIAAGYGGRLRKDWLKRSERAGPSRVKAFDFFVRAMNAFDTFTKDGLVRAKELFAEAIDLDPHYARAYAKLSWAHIVEAVDGWSDDYAGSMAKGEAYARRSIEVEDDESWGHWALAGYYMFTMQHEQALAEFERALELNPNDADVLTDAAYCLNYAGRHEEALEAASRAMRLNPHYPHWYMMQWVALYFDAGRYEDALSAFARMSKVETVNTWLFKAASHAALGQSEQAHLAVEQALSLDPDATITKWTSDRMVPYQLDTDRQHLRDNLRKAGLPE